MYLSSENRQLKSYQSYLIDALRFALSVSPNSIPCDDSIGIELRRVADFEDITRYEVRKILDTIDPRGRLELISCILDRDTIEITVRFNDSGDTYKVSMA